MKKLIETKDLRQVFGEKSVVGFFLAPALMKWMKLDKINKLYDKVADFQGRDCLEAFLAEMRISYEIPASDLANLPKEGPFITVSNHAYGYGTGWEGVYFYGGKTQRQDPDFGLYGMDARDWDALCYSAPYYLPFKSAGNDRDDHAPGEGATFYYLFMNTWQSDVYHASTCPQDDGAYGGWNTISYHGVAKNAVTVGAVDAAVSGGQRDLAAADRALQAQEQAGAKQ